jgi:hypothetical protein
MANLAGFSQAETPVSGRREYHCQKDGTASDIVSTCHSSALLIT